MSTYYDKEGQQIDRAKWAALFSNKEYVRVALSDSEDGNTRVSTIWLGLDHGFGGERQIFETMVFQGDDEDDIDMQRYATISEALEGHAEMAEKWIGSSEPDAD